MMRKVVKAGVFKAECLKMMDEVQETQIPLWITKHGKLVAKLVAIKEEKHPLFGKMKGTIDIHGDIVESIGEVWDADS